MEAPARRAAASSAACPQRPSGSRCWWRGRGPSATRTAQPPRPGPPRPARGCSRGARIPPASPAGGLPPQGGCRSRWPSRGP
eukprot:7744897-Alexandrium_andersonii.AAC.1